MAAAPRWRMLHPRRGGPPELPGVIAQSGGAVWVARGPGAAAADERADRDDSEPPSLREIALLQADVAMFWFNRNTFSGSYRRLRDPSRRYVLSPYAARTRASPSSPRKLTYAPRACGSSLAKCSRAQAMFSASSSGRSHCAIMLVTNAAVR